MTTVNNTQAAQQTQALKAANSNIKFDDAAKNNQKFSIFMQITKDYNVDIAQYDTNDDKIMSNEELEAALKELQAKRIRENPDGSQESEHIDDAGNTAYTITNPAGKITHDGLKRPDGTKRVDYSGKDFDGDGTPDQYVKYFDEEENLVRMEEYDKESGNTPGADPIAMTVYDEEGNEISKTRRERWHE